MRMCCVFAAKRSSNFVVGLTNVSPNISTPTLYNYTLCGQYPGDVPIGATVSLYCQKNLPPFRYVIVQFPRNGHMNICELEVLVVGITCQIFFYAHSCAIFCVKGLSCHLSPGVPVLSQSLNFIIRLSSASMR